MNLDEAQSKYSIILKAIEANRAGIEKLLAKRGQKPNKDTQALALQMTEVSDYDESFDPEVDMNFSGAEEEHGFAFGAALGGLKRLFRKPDGSPSKLALAISKRAAGKGGAAAAGGDGAAAAGGDGGAAAGGDGAAGTGKILGMEKKTAMIVGAIIFVVVIIVVIIVLKKKKKA